MPDLPRIWTLRACPDCGNADTAQSSGNERRAAGEIHRNELEQQAMIAPITVHVDLHVAAGRNAVDPGNEIALASEIDETRAGRNRLRNLFSHKSNLFD